MRPTFRAHSPSSVLASTFSLIFALFLAPTPAGAEAPATQPFPGITVQQEVRTDPPEHLFAARIDLSNPRVHVRVAPGGPDPDGPGPWETTLMTPTSIAEREAFDLVVNGDFFGARDTKDAEGKQSGYRPGLWATTIGAAVTDGKVWAVSKTKRPCLVVHKDRSMSIEPVDTPSPDAWEVVSGNTMLISDGEPVPQTNTARHPRTAVGLDPKGMTLTILVVDGRKPGVSIGMTYTELAAELLKRGCWQGLNLDGGGSSAMAIRDPADHHYRIINDPSDGHERAVADVLGITVDPMAAMTPGDTSRPGP